MDKIGVKNLRSLTDSGDLDIKPLTILVGKNSSGKSTFARLFPLFKQSVNKANDGSILWYGDLVDFGDFRNAVNSFLGRNGTIEFTLSFRTPNTMRREIDQDFNSSNTIGIRSSILIPFKVSLKYIDAKVGQNSLYSIDIDIYDHSIRFLLDKGNEIKSIKINDQEYRDDSIRFRRLSNIDFLPRISYSILRKVGDSFEIFQANRSFKDKKLIDTISKLIRSDATNNYKRRLVNNLRLNSKAQMLRNFGERDKFGAPISSKALTWTTSSPGFTSIVNDYIYYILDEILVSANQYIETYFSGVKYIAPLRASADRYYRIQNLSVTEIDTDGKNLPMILKSMSKKDLDKFNKWLFENFCFNISVHNSEGHMSIKVKEGNSDKMDNLSDMGFGYSQILPIITQLWLSQSIDPSYFRRLSRNMTETIVIEQPELHLHPAMQAMFIDAIIKILKQNNSRSRQINVIVETHSDVIINRISQMIRQKEISDKDTAIYVFDKAPNSATQIVKSGFDEKGFVVNWPLGFFTPAPPVSKQSKVSEFTEDHGKLNVNLD